MSQFLLYYQRPEPATWVYLSSFLMIGLYFVFHRFWSIRNLDIVLLLLLGPGLLLVHEGRKQEISSETNARAAVANGVQLTTRTLQSTESTIENSADAGPAEPRNQVAEPSPGTVQAEIPQPANQQTEQSEAFEPALDPIAVGIASEPRTVAQNKQLRGFIWLFIIEAAILLRLLLDPMMVRRPLLDPNLTTGGLVFIGVSMLIFLMANVITSTPEIQREQGPALGPGYPVLNMLPAISTTPDSEDRLLASETSAGGAKTSTDAPSTSLELKEPEDQVAYAALARTLAIAAHLAVIVGITMIGYRHFGNFKAGAGCATLYLLLPYTAQMTGRVDHVLPAALLVWAILMYRRPLVAGICLGLAAGLVYYPAFLLPLWLGFYRQRGLARFAGGVAATMAVLTVLLSFGGSEDFKQRLIQMYGLWLPWTENLEGVWGLGWQPVWRLPVLVAFILLAGLYSFWPRQKNLGSLMSCSAALMVAAQFWHGFGGGLFIAWFLPLLLLTIFRPNLEDRVALKVIGGAASRRPAQARPDINAA